MERDLVKVVLIDDDPEDFAIIQDFLGDVTEVRYHIEWIRDAEHGLSALKLQNADVYLIDYRLDGCTGLELIDSLPSRELLKPMILLTGYGSHELDVSAMEKGVSNFLSKSELSAELLERSIRYGLKKADDHARILVNERLKAEKDAAELANQLKTIFLANMSHEIRTPLSAILGFAELAVRPGSSVAQKDQYLEVIVKNGKRLLTLINDLLDISKIEAGKVELRKMDFSWKDVVAEVVELLKPSCVAKGVKMLADQPSEIPAGLYSDSHHFHRILLNMVGNAVKFTEKGKVEIKARTEVRDGTNWLKISVIDSGVGIDVASQANLFKPFSQAEGGRKFGGTGLGLNLSRTLAKALGGDLIMEYSTLGEGSTFSLILPYLRAAAQITIPKSAIGPRKKRAHNLSVLLIEDSDDNRFLIQEFLQSDGIKVDTANDGKQGLEKALAGEHDAVLMDIQMPVMDGIEATRRLRDFGYRKPIIALTASAMGEEKAKGLGYGFDTYLTKPVNRERLLSTLSALE